MSSPPLRIELRPSGRLRACLVGVAALAVVAVLRSEAPSAMLALIPCMLFAGWRGAGGAGKRNGGRNGVDAIVFRADGSVAVLRNDSEVPVAHCAFDRRGPLSVLTFTRDNAPERHVFLSDTLDRAGARRLHLWFERQVRGAASKQAPTEATHV